MSESRLAARDVELLNFERDWQLHEGRKEQAVLASESSLSSAIATDVSGC